MKDSPAKLAVLMSVYAPGKDLERTLDSLRRQSVPFTLFLVDDGSPRRPDYHSLLEGMDYRLIELPQNLGVSAAVNMGLEQVLASDIEYVARMDCGDIAEPARLETQLHFLNTHCQIGIVGTCAHLVVEERKWCFHLRVPTSAKDIHRQLYYRMPFINPSLMLRASVFRRIGFYSPDMAEDYELIRRADRVGIGLANIDRILTVKIENSGSISRRKHRQQCLSRLQIQWRYRNLRNADCILGLLKSAAQTIVPLWFLDRMKCAMRDGEPLLP